jgi:two-component sensor histidine kinase
MNLDITNAIPCGLIINELITNSFKYATSENEDLEISVSLLLLNNKIVELEVRDNGKGINEEIINSNDSNTTLGIELIKSLSDQINGTYSFRNYKGLIYNLKFNLTAEKKYS